MDEYLIDYIKAYIDARVAYEIAILRAGLREQPSARVVCETQVDRTNLALAEDLLLPYLHPAE